MSTYQCPFVYTLSMAASCCGGTVSNGHRDFVAHNVKYLSSAPFHNKFAESWIRAFVYSLSAKAHLGTEFLPLPRLLILNALSCYLHDPSAIALQYPSHSGVMQSLASSYLLIFLLFGGERFCEVMASPSDQQHCIFYCRADQVFFGVCPENLPLKIIF